MFSQCPINHWGTLPLPDVYGNGLSHSFCIYTQEVWPLLNWLCVCLLSEHMTYYCVILHLQHEAEFRSFLKAAKGTVNEKRLASQFICRFFKYFPSIHDEAINVLFELCEDPDQNVSNFHLVSNFFFLLSNCFEY